MQQIYDEQLRRIQAATRASGGSTRAIDAALAEDPPKIAEQVQSFYSEVTSAAAVDAVAQVPPSVKIDWGRVNTAVLRLAQDEAERFAAQMTETSQAQTSRTIADWISTGGTMDDLIDRVSQVWAGARADVAAVTEVTRLYAQGNAAAWQTSDVVKAMEWRTSNDEAVCPICGPLANSKVPFGGELPPAHPNCRCWVVPVIGGSDEIGDAIEVVEEPTPTTLTGDPLQDYPSLGVLGKTLRIDGYDDSVVQQHVRDLALVPESLLAQARKAGIKDIHFGPVGMPYLDSNEYARGVQPRGWPPGMTWDDVPGGYNPRARSVVAGRGDHGCTSLALHEYGHALGHLLNYDNDVRLIALHKQIFNRLDPYLRQDGPGGYAGRHELVAEGFATVVKDRVLATKTYGPEFVHFVEDVMLRGAPAQTKGGR